MALAIVLITLILIADILFFPTLLNCVFVPILQIEPFVEGSAFLNWGIVFQDVARNITFGFHFLLVALIMTILTSILSKNNSSLNSDAYGSSRFMTNEEFDALTPSYIFKSDEQEHIEENNHTELQINKTSSVNIFEDINFEIKEVENNVEEKETDSD